MRYSRVLTVLALIGVVALTATLVTPGARSAPKPRRAAVTKPTLQGALLQQLQQLQPLLSTHPPVGQSLAAPLGRNLPPPARPCPVSSGSCSGNPCVYFVNSGSQPVGLAVGAAVQANLTAPSLPGGPGSRGCTRHALPRTFRVTGQIQALGQPADTRPAGIPVLVGRASRSAR